MALGKNKSKSNGTGTGSDGNNGSEIPDLTHRAGKVVQMGHPGGVAGIISEASAQKYDPAEFIIPGQDAQGHSERIYCRVQPSVAMHIGRTVSDHKFPFRTNGDLIRWSVWTGLKLLDMLEPTPNTFLVRSEAVHALLREEIYQQEYMATLDSIQKVVQQYLSMGAKGEAARTVAKVKAQWEKIEEKYWREKCLSELKSRFGYLLETGGAAKLTGPNNPPEPQDIM